MQSLFREILLSLLVFGIVIVLIAKDVPNSVDISMFVLECRAYYISKGSYKVEVLPKFGAYYKVEVCSKIKVYSKILKKFFRKCVFVGSSK